MQDLDIQVGDRITYKYINTTNKKKITRLVIDEQEIKDYKDMASDTDKECSIEILKIERLKYEVIEEEKELLTEEEREFLKDIIKYYKNIYYLSFDKSNMIVREKSGRCVLAIDKPNNMFFESIENNKDYEISELGLEE